MTQSCMGGFKCLKRDTCVWHQTEDRREVHEKLCEPGQYGAYIAINLHQVQQHNPTPAVEPANA